MSRGFLPQKRHRSREMALQLLYSLDLRENQTPEQAFELYFSNDDEEVEGYARMLTAGAWEKRMEIDSIIREFVTGWRPERMVAVDRAALRMCIYECLIVKAAPVPVAISEAVELVKVFGTEESGRFVNGALGRIVRNYDHEGEHDGEDNPG
ncbi:MAG: transcription antitermination factor NusB [Synergistaceae bacterium]|nr:transcription antitermination factor NusB [Synergistaceae bacterium]